MLDGERKGNAGSRCKKNREERIVLSHGKVSGQGGDQTQ